MQDDTPASPANARIVDWLIAIAGVLGSAAILLAAISLVGPPA